MEARTPAPLLIKHCVTSGQTAPRSLNHYPTTRKKESPSSLYMDFTEHRWQPFCNHQTRGEFAECHSLIGFWCRAGRAVHPNAASEGLHPATSTQPTAPPSREEDYVHPSRKSLEKVSWTSPPESKRFATCKKKNRRLQNKHPFFIVSWPAECRWSLYHTLRNTSGVHSSRVHEQSDISAHQLLQIQTGDITINHLSDVWNLLILWHDSAHTEMKTFGGGQNITLKLLLRSASQRLSHLTWTCLRRDKKQKHR